MELSEIITKLEKSKIKAGDGKKVGKYPLYTCSPTVDKFYDKYLYDTEAIILSTGGNPVINYYNGKFAYSTDCLVIKTNDEFEEKYIYYYLISKIDNISKMFRGVGIKHLNKNEFFKLKITMIDKNKQKEIVTNLDKVDNIIELKKEQLKEYDNIIKSQFVEMFGDPFFNEYNWKIGTVRELVSDVRYGTSKPSNDGGKYKYLRMNNITYNGKLDLTDIKYIDIPENEVEKCSTKNGDVLFNRTNSRELVGKTCVYNLDEEMVIAGFVIRVRVNDLANPYFLSEYLNTKYMKKNLYNMCKNASGQSNINAQELQNIKIYIPPIELQNKFAEFVKQIDKQKFEIENSLKEMQELYESLMEKYFE